ncbi:MAG: efflux RND transporter permease subunit, partial [Candidatus Omnitrophica bacterium]|nr:efflux RND transporter permease subunit [Candidatus Omnitrophota bacterium]
IYLNLIKKYKIAERKRFDYKSKIVNDILLSYTYDNKKNVKEELAQIEGVGAIEIVGGLEREITVEVLESKLRSAYLSIIDVSSALEKANLNYPAGTIKEPFFEYLIRTVGEFENIKEIETLPIKAEFPVPKEKLSYFSEYYKMEEQEQGIYLPASERLIFVKDIGNVRDGTKERESISRYQGKECVTILIRKQALANSVRLSAKIREAIKDIEKKIPSPIKLNIVYDEANFIKESLVSVRNSAIQGAVLAFLVILFFLKNVWFSLSIIFSIPISIIVVFLLMFFSKLTLNLISLGGLALGVGMVVDNSIVVLESIFINKDPIAKEKAIKGTKEVGLAILGSTLTTICVFLPMIFVIGIAGQLFKQLAFSIVFSLIASLVVAITILPLFIYLYLRKKNLKDTQKEIKLDFWEKTFSFIFKYRILTLISILIIFVLSLYVFTTIQRELLPKIDQNEFTIKIETQPGTPLDKTDIIVKKIEEVISQEKEVEEITSTIGSSSETAEEKAIQSQGPHQAQVFVKLDKNTYTTQFIKKLGEKLNPLFDKNVTINILAQESFLKEAFIQQAPLIFDIKGVNIDNLKKIGIELMDKLNNLPYLYNVKLDFPPPRPEVKVEVVKDKAFLYNISTQTIAAIVNISLKGIVPTKFKEKGEEYDIRVVLTKRDRENVNKLKRLLIHGIFQDKPLTVPLMEIAKISRGVGPLEIKRKEGERLINITASIYKMPLSKVIEDINKTIKGLSLPLGYRTEISGEAESMKESFNSLKFALILSIILVFMVMASQFESLWQPLIILTTIPLSLIGVTLILFLTKSTLNVISALGLIMLGGIIVNNGIVLIDYTNILRREQGVGLEEAVKLASVRRIRPILMTSLTTIFGILPLSLSEDSLMQPLGLVTIGGLFTGTILTPIVVPILYYYYEKFFSTLFKRKEEIYPVKERTPLVEEKTILETEKKPAPIFTQISKKYESKFIQFEEEKEKKKEEEIEPIPTPPSQPTYQEIKEKEEKVSISPSTQTIEEIEIKKLYKETDLFTRQKELLNYLKEHHQITRVEYAKIFNVSIPTAARDLKKLINLGLIEAKGPSGPGRIYVLKEKLSGNPNI